MFFFFLLQTGSFKFAWDSFTMVFAQNSSILHWAVHQPITFLPFWSLMRQFEPLTEELWLPLQSHISSRVWMGTNHLATKCNYYARLLTLKYSWVQGVFEESLVWSMTLQPTLHTSTEEARQYRLGPYLFDALLHGHFPARKGVGRSAKKWK